MNPSPKQRKAAIFGGALLLLVLLGWIDYRTGYELGFFVFYSAPVGITAWYVGRRSGIVMALAASLTWWLADFYAGAKYSSRFYFYWNTAIRFGCFVLNAVTIARIHDMLSTQRRLDAQLGEAREEVRKLAAALPFCPRCHQPHRGQPGAPLPASYTEALCPGCRTSQTPTPSSP